MNVVGYTMHKGVICNNNSIERKQNYKGTNFYVLLKLLVLIITRLLKTKILTAIFRETTN